MRVVVLLSLFSTVLTISFKLAADGSRCIKEEAHKDVLVVGEFTVENIPETHEVDIKVTDTKDQILFSKEKADTGKFAFTLDDYDMFSICFYNKRTAGMDMGSGRQPPVSDLDVKLSVKRGIEAKTYNELAKAKKLKPMELELKKLEDLAEAIVSDFAYMKSREKLMRDTNESTNSRVLWFSIFSMAVLLGLALWQVFYLKRFFKAKKLIE